MPKLIYLLWAPSGEPRDAFCERLLDDLPRKAARLGARSVVLQARDSDARVRSPAPGSTGRAPFDAMLSLCLDDVGARGRFELALEARSARVHGYLAEETLYTDYGGNRHARPRDWPDEERSPGVVSVTLMERPARLLYADWIAIWHGRQSPLSELMQPRTRYVRNVITRCLTPHAPIYGGIVEEAWPSRTHVEDPYLFYGACSLSGLSENMGAMLRSVTSFLDLPRIQTVMTSEYFVLA